MQTSFNPLVISKNNQRIFLYEPKKVILKKEKNSLTYKYFIIYGIISFLLIIASRIIYTFNLGIKCLFKMIFKIPCLTCGSTRVMLNLSYLNIEKAFFSNPLFFLLVLICLTLMVIALGSFIFDLPKYEIILSERERKIFIGATIIIIIANWIYLIIAGV